MAEAPNSTNGTTNTPVEAGAKSGSSPASLPCTPASPAGVPADEKGDGEDQSQDMGSEDSQVESDEEEGKPEILEASVLEERLGEAKKAVLVGRYEEAMQLLPSCLATITDKEGELSIKLAEPHYLYGKSMFECARMTAGVLEEGALKPKTDKSTEKVDVEDDAESTDDVNETEPNNFEVAWENLEVSRVICSNKLEMEDTNVAVAKILLEVLNCLGELQVETGCYDKAAADYTECLQLLKKYPDIATENVEGATQYSMGISFSLAGEHQLAVEALSDALGVLTKLLEKSEDKASLQELIDEIKPRLAEAVDQAREKIEQLKLQSESDQPTSSSNGDKLDEVISKPVMGAVVKVNDISHLVRKKRSASEPSSESTSPKKAKQELEVCPDQKT
eukprot:TRINITY_DN2018_c0_g1_i1.p2 TRINITY_DN2018_c0_g1~~TRINITY_DN2018_c0_g1_i1.p2  ORF type:complete len:392 (-),score=123.76 TRINITY_DN2018_c0_g1_i1:64-1239(-)